MALLKHKSDISRLLFTDKAPIKRHSKEYDDFWIFLKKYEIREQQAAKNKDFNDKSALSRINFTPCFEGNIKDEKAFIADAKTHTSLKTDEIKSVYRAFSLYLNYLQRQKFIKYRKLREFQKNLPIAERKDQILKLLEENSVLLIAGDTGCGKSTQVPQYLLNAGYTGIVCTQPRRIATVSLCQRVAHETLSENSNSIGYQIRFERRKDKSTKMLFMTHGLLIRQAISDPTLSEYNVIILDEIHERNLSCDFLLGLIKCILHQRPNDLKLILMSATINIELFSSYFNYCPVVQVPGRLYPITLHYRPVTEEGRRTKSGRLNPEPYLRVLELIDHKYPISDQKGDVLVFLSGISEITALQEALQEHSDRWIALPLHSSLSIVEQEKVFADPPNDKRKVVLSTNIAETSVTIDGIRFVLDSGKCKEMTFDNVCRMQRLKEFWTSKAGAEQRKGRAGRTGPGECFRLYSEDEFEAAMQAYSTPEIQRLPLHSLLLQLIHMGLPDVRKFPFLEPPSTDAIEESLQTLKEQGALNRNETLTPIGRFLAILPVDIMVGKLLLLGSLFPSIMESVLTLGAALSTQSIFTMKSYRDLDICSARRFLESSSGDPFAILNAFEHLNVECYKHGGSARHICKRLGLDLHRYYEMHKLRALFRRLLEDHGICSKRSRDSESLSSIERSKRHGERRKLLELRKEKEKEERERKNKKRKLSEFGDELSEDEFEGQMDIGEIELRLSQDASSMQKMMDPTARLNQREKAVLRWVFASAVYPQVAIADVHNSYTAGSDQVFHTKTKGFVVLHPNSIFAMNPSHLQLDEKDVLKLEKGLATSTRHQLVAFMSLLETNKAQLLNMTRVPTLPTMLLCASSIDSNAQLTRLVFDSFIEIGTEHNDDMTTLVLRVLHARKWLNIILDRMLIETVERVKNDWETTDNEESNKKKEAEAEPEVSPETRRMQRHLFALIDDVLQSYHSVPFTQKRLLAADLKHLYNPDRSLLDPDAQSAATLFEMDDIKGGFKMADFFTFASLDGGPIPRTWKHGASTTATNDSDDEPEAKPDVTSQDVLCPGCDVTLDRQESFPIWSKHVLECGLHPKLKISTGESTSGGAEKAATEHDEDESANPAAPNSVKYNCPDCGKTMHLTPYQVFQHKKSHKESVS